MEWAAYENLGKLDVGRPRYDTVVRSLGFKKTGGR
jgi:hypothetical protein